MIILIFYSLNLLFFCVSLMIHQWLFRGVGRLMSGGMGRVMGRHLSHSVANSWLASPVLSLIWSERWPVCWPGRLRCSPVPPVLVSIPRWSCILCRASCPSPHPLPPCMPWPLSPTPLRSPPASQPNKTGHPAILPAARPWSNSDWIAYQTNCHPCMHQFNYIIKYHTIYIYTFIHSFILLYILLSIYLFDYILFLLIYTSIKI